jgi:hypothetical protein
VLSKRVNELSGLNADLQNHLQGLRHELAVANAELRLRGSRMPDIELRNDEEIAPGSSTRNSSAEDVHNAAHVSATSVAPSYDASGRVVSTAARRSIQATEVKDLHHQ